MQSLPFLVTTINKSCFCDSHIQQINSPSKLPSLRLRSAVHCILNWRHLSCVRRWMKVLLSPCVWWLKIKAQEFSSTQRGFHFVRFGNSLKDRRCSTWCSIRSLASRNNWKTNMWLLLLSLNDCSFMNQEFQSCLHHRSRAEITDINMISVSSRNFSSTKNLFDAFLPPAMARDLNANVLCHSFNANL